MSPRASWLSARTILEKVRPAPSTRSEHGFPALLKAVEAAIVRRRIVEGTPGARRSGARSAASDQEQEREADNQFSHCCFLRMREVRLNWLSELSQGSRPAPGCFVPSSGGWD